MDEGLAFILTVCGLIYILRCLCGGVRVETSPERAKPVAGPRKPPSIPTVAIGGDLGELQRHLERGRVKHEKARERAFQHHRDEVVALLDRY